MAKEVRPWRLTKAIDPRLNKVVKKLERTWIDTGAVQDGAFEKRYGWCSQKGMMLENRMYHHKAFSYMHLELACVQTGNIAPNRRLEASIEQPEASDPADPCELQVLHCVAMPHPCYALPILGADIVIRRGKWTLCIADTSPTGEGLPPTYAAKVESLQQSIFSPQGGWSNAGRRMPSWGAKIFSPLCISIQPTSEEEVLAFVDYIVQLHNSHINYAQRLAEEGPDPSMERNEVRRKAMLQYNKGQQENDKTKSVLARHFGNRFAEEYITQVLFNEHGITLGR